MCFPAQLGIHRQFPTVPKEELHEEFYNEIAPKAVAKPQKKVTTQESNHE
jgi:hypothetical protein